MIGITAYAEPSVRWGAWDVPAAVIPLAYVQQVEAAGGRALLVPPSEEAIDETLDALDGLLFSGGSDIDPAEYGQDAASPRRPERARSATAASWRSCAPRSSATCPCSRSAAAPRC